MSHALDELTALAKQERTRALEGARQLPAAAGRAVRSCAREHPLWTFGGLTVLTALGTAIAVVQHERRRRKPAAVRRAKAGKDRKPKGARASWIAALFPLAARLLPFASQALGFDDGLVDEKDGKEEEGQARSETSPAGAAAARGPLAGREA